MESVGFKDSRKMGSIALVLHTETTYSERAVLIMNLMQRWQDIERLVSKCGASIIVPGRQR